MGLPPGSVVHVPGRGELFVRDSGTSAPALLLLHGWTATADLNWAPAYAPLIQAGHRVIALDHRGHGRGLRTPDAFRLEDCAHDAAALVAHLDCGPVVAVGYSMGGPIAQLLARDHPQLLRGMVLCATSREWRSPRMQAIWRGMGLLRLVLGLLGESSWRTGLRRMGFPDDQTTTWVAAELSRGSARDIAEAGRELGRYDSRPWISSLSTPAAVVVTARDRDVPPDKQRALAASLHARTYEVAGDHLAIANQTTVFMDALSRALRELTPAGAVPASLADVG